MTKYRELLAQAARLDREIRQERVRRIRAAVVAYGDKMPQHLHVEVMAVEECVRQVIVDNEMFDEHLSYIEDLIFE